MRDPKTGTVYVDNTTLAAMASCDSKGALQCALGYRSLEEAHVLEAGIVLHEVLADYMARRLTPEQCLVKLNLCWRPYSDAHDLDIPWSPSTPNQFYRLGITNMMRCMTEWFERRPLNSFPFSINPEFVEVGFTLPLLDECVCGHTEAEHGDRGCRLRGRCQCREYRPAFVFWGKMDAVVQSAHDLQLYVLDHKSTGRLTDYWADKFRNDSQMSGYVWAAQRTLGQDIVGVYINGIELKELPASQKKCRDHKVPYAECGALHMKEQLLIFTRTEEQLERWHRSAVALAREYKTMLDTITSPEDVAIKTDMRGSFHGGCMFCDFKKFCAGGQPADLLDEMAVYKPWRPLQLEHKESAA